MGLTRKKFKEQLQQAIENADYYVRDDAIEKFLDLNYDEDSSIVDWNYSEFTDFAHELCHQWGNFWATVRQFDLHYPGEDGVAMLLDDLQAEFDKKRLGVDIYDGDDYPYLECTKSIEPVKNILARDGINIIEEFNSSGSDYDSYIIKLELYPDEDEEDDDRDEKPWDCEKHFN